MRNFFSKFLDVLGIILTPRATVERSYLESSTSLAEYEERQRFLARCHRYYY